MPREQEQNNKNAAYPLDRYTVDPKNTSDKQDASPYYQGQAPAITLPKGGGALKGIDEKFNVNAINGTAGLEVPFPLTPGRSGFTPSLSLTYNSGGGNSEFGLGWAMTLPAIQRKTDRRLPVYNDAEDSDVFLLAGAEDLVPVLNNEGQQVTRTEGDYFIKQYRPRIEGLFARIEHIRKTTTSDSWWRVASRDNTIIWYGLTPEARITDPDDLARIFKWLPQVAFDQKGNVQSFGYVQENDANVLHAPHETNRINGTASYTNTYLKHVGYSNLVAEFIDPVDSNQVWEPQIPTPVWLMEAVLDYGDHDAGTPDYDPVKDWDARTDAFSDYHAGFEIRTYRRCRRVLMFHRFRELSDGDTRPVLVRSLDLTYIQDEAVHDPLTPDEHAGIDYIKTITQKGYYYDSLGQQISKALPAIELSYQPIIWDHTIRNVTPDNAANAPQGLTGPYQWTDFFGEGIPGILSEQGTAWWYKRNLGEGQFTHALPLAPKPSFAGLGAGLSWADLDVDGNRQLVSYNNELPGYFEASMPTADDIDGIQNWDAFRNFKDNINVDWNSPFTRMLDLDGDGRSDLLITDDRVITWYRNEGKEGFTNGGYTPFIHDEEKGPRLLLNDAVQSVFLADINGDGLTDLVRIRNGEVCYWPNKGFGKFGAKVTMSNAPVFDDPATFDPRYIYITDITGTGAADILYLAHAKCTAYVNRSGNSFSEGVDISTLPGMELYSNITVVDFLGNGTGCIVWSSPLPQYSDAPLRYIDLMGGKKPHLLTTYSNGMGKTVSLVYKSSTKYYLQDRQEGAPWATKLPFPVHCIDQITTADSVSETTYTQLYRYHHGYYDHAEREFRGFGRVDVIDTDKAKAYLPGTETSDDLNQDPVLTKSWYHTGAWMESGLLTTAYEKEYFRPQDWITFDDTIVLQDRGNMKAKEEREAYRAVKGALLRQEVYALDASLQQDIPYTVTAYSYRVQRLQALPAMPQTGPGTYPNAVFFSLREQQLSWNCERDAADPRVAQEITLASDAYGNILEVAQIVYPRADIPGTLPAPVQSAQQKLYVTYNRNTFTNAITNGNFYYRLPMTATAIGCELYVPVADYPDGLWTRDTLNSYLAGMSIVDYTTTPGGSVKLLRKLSHTKVLYREDDAETVLPLGTIAPLAILHEQYTMAFSSSMVNAPFTSAQIAEGGYIDLDSDGNYWLPSGIAGYSINPRGDFYSVYTYTDPWNNTTSVTYWESPEGEGYFIVPLSTSDALGNYTAVNAYNWSILQPVSIIDANDNISEIAYDALGMPVAMALRGKGSGTEGDNLDALNIEDNATQLAFWSDPEANASLLLGNATFRCVYDLNAQPVAVAMIGREQHYAQLHNSPLLVRFTYTDGFGRIAMNKVQAADDPIGGTSRWIGSGKTVYNNKGNAVLQYEPYFSNTHTCDTAEQAAAATVSPRMHYDPLGRLRRTDMPDGSFSYTVWDSWMQVSYDANDAVAGSAWYTAYSTGTSEQQDAAAKALAHSNTPTVVHFDTLARPFYTVQFLTAPSSLTGGGDIESFETLDIQGNRHSVTDGRGNVTLTYTYTMLKTALSQWSMDSGQQYAITDAGGNPLYTLDADNRSFHSVYDALRRPVRREVVIVAVNKVLERMSYGEAETSPATRNLRGQLFRHYDGAGLLECGSYDFKGNPLSVTRTYTDATTAHPDWTTPGSVTMESTGYAAATTYDALNRPVQATAPDTGITAYTYEKSGALYGLSVSGVHALSSNIINSVTYNALGQRLRVQYQNGSTTAYEYDPKTFRVTRIRTTRSSDSATLQDLHYWYDPVGNITSQEDQALQTVYFANAVADPANNYTYDALYRLITTKGRELVGNQGATTNADASRSLKDAMPFINDPIDVNNAAAMRRYIQNYSYDEAGNMLQQQHVVTGGTGNWTRNFTISGSTNKLLGSSIGSNGSGTDSYTYDARGNLIAGMNHLNAGATCMYYNELNRLERVVLDSTRTAYYQYDAAGQRVRKTIVNTGSATTEVRKYVGEWEVYSKFVSSSLTLARETLHVSDDTGRIALIDTRTTGTGTEPAQLMRYQFSNHLGTATLELDASAAVISYEEYYPYGSTSFQSGRSLAEVSLKRYRYTGKERDEETGLYYHGARYYAPWLSRWCAVDPLETKYTPWSSYNYGLDNPVTWKDPTGMGVTGGDNNNLADSGDPGPATRNGGKHRVGDSIPGYLDLTSRFDGLIKEAVNAYRGVSNEGAEIVQGPISTTYNEQLAKFEGGGSYSTVGLTYRATSQAGLNNLRRKFNHPLPDSTDTKGATLVVVHLKNSNKLEILGRDRERYDPDSIESFSILIAINEKMDAAQGGADGEYGAQYMALLTLNHELTMHAVKLANIIKNGGSISEVLSKLVAENPDVHHNDFSDASSTYNTVNEEIARFKTDVSSKRGATDVSEYFSGFAIMRELTGPVNVPSNTVGNRFRIFVNNIASAATGHLPPLPTNRRVADVMQITPGGVLQGFDFVIKQLPIR